MHAFALISSLLCAQLAPVAEPASPLPLSLSVTPAPQAAPVDEKPTASAHAMADATATPAQVKLGEPFSFAVHIAHPPDARVEPAAKPDFGDFDIDGVQQQTKAQAGAALSTFTFKATGWDPEKNEFPALKFTLRGGAADGETLWSPATKIAFVSTLAQGQAEPADVAPPVPWYIRDYTLLWIAGGLAALALIALGAWLASRFREAQPQPAGPPPRPVPAHLTARKALQRAGAMPLSEYAEVKAYYFEVSQIVRVYLGVLFDIDATELTTEEFFSATKGRAVPGLQMVAVRAFFDHADLVKFSRHRPAPEECTDLMSQAAGFVLATEPVSLQRHAQAVTEYERQWGPAKPETFSAAPKAARPRAVPKNAVS